MSSIHTNLHENQYKQFLIFSFLIYSSAFNKSKFISDDQIIIMIAQEEERGEYRDGKYQIVIIPKSETEFEVFIKNEITNTVFVKRGRLNKVRSTTIMKAFSKQVPGLFYLMQEKGKQLFLKVIVTSQIFQTFSEIIELSSQNQRDNSSKIPEMKDQFNGQSIIKQLEKRLSSYGLSQPKVYSYQSKTSFKSPQVDSELYNEQQAVQFERIIQIPIKQQGRYLIQLSFFLKASSSYFFLHQNRSYSQKIMPKSGLVSPNPECFIPISFKLIVDTSITKQKLQSFQIYDAYDYPCQLKNIVLTMQKLS